MKNKAFFALLAAFFLFLSCENSLPSPKLIPAAYFWKTQFTWSRADSVKAQHMDLKKLYIRYFDIKVDDAGVLFPNAINQNGCTDLDEKIEAIPVVFILNSVFTTCKDSAAIEGLAEKTSNLIRKLHKKNALKEVQFDCDWTKSTATTYFYFLKKIKTHFPNQKLSCTLRLWQFKDRQTSGVPPADRVMLMAYNLQNPTKWEVENSILDPREAAKFLQHQRVYPLPMDLALPRFYWSVLFRNGQFQGFLPKTKAETLEAETFFKKIESNRYQCTLDTFWHQTYLLRGDLIRSEAVSEKTSEAVKAMVAPYLNAQDSACLSYFEF